MRGKRGTTICGTGIKVVLGACIALSAPSAFAHCDALDGPVVKAAQKALAAGDVNHVLIWVRKQDESEVRAAFEKIVAVRKLGADAKELADRYFFETLVRLHRAGEDAPYTGLKPAGRDPGPAIRAGDEALQSGKLDPVSHLISAAVEHGLRTHFETVMAAKKFRDNDVESGRRFVQAYVEYIHYVERLHEAAAAQAHGHFPEGEKTSEHTETGVTSAMVGHWVGNGRIIVTWCNQTNLPIAVHIHSDGSVTGKIGDAVLANGRLEPNRGWLGRKLHLKTDYIIAGDLTGSIVAAEPITRSGVKMPLNFGAGGFVGGRHTSGSKFGGKERMILSAGLSLTRTSPSTASISH